jgi:hypothetical protein
MCPYNTLFSVNKTTGGARGLYVWLTLLFIKPKLVIAQAITNEFDLGAGYTAAQNADAIAVIIVAEVIIFVAWAITTHFINQTQLGLIGSLGTTTLKAITVMLLFWWLVTLG